MKKTLRLASLIMTVLIIAGCMLISCSSNVSYKDDVSVSTLSSAAKKQIEINSGYITTDEDYIEFNFENFPAAKEGEIFIASNSSSNKNEVGIFHFTNSEETASAKTSIEKYLKSKDDSYKSSIDYTPNEYPKIENAKVEIFGNYVVYTVLTSDDSAKVINTVKDALAK